VERNVVQDGAKARGVLPGALPQAAALIPVPLPSAALRSATDESGASDDALPDVMAGALQEAHSAADAGKSADPELDARAPVGLAACSKRLVPAGEPRAAEPYRPVVVLSAARPCVAAGAVAPGDALGAATLPRLAAAAEMVSKPQVVAASRTLAHSPPEVRRAVLDELEQAEPVSKLPAAQL
jgi:hypothetical protein